MVNDVLSSGRRRLAKNALASVSSIRVGIQSAGTSRELAQDRKLARNEAIAAFSDTFVFLIMLAQKRETAPVAKFGWVSCLLLLLVVVALQVQGDRFDMLTTSAI